MSAGTFEYQAVEGVYEHAASLIKKGKNKAEVRADLKSRGLNDESAAVVADNIFELRAKVVREAGQQNMLYGSLWCIGGIAVAAVPYLGAADFFKRRHNVIAWGAIVFGTVQFFRGLAQNAGKAKAQFI
jgi:hypothetical protein